MPFILIDETLASEAIQAARNSTRHRSLYPLHKRNEDKVHRLLRALEPDSYVAPHRHDHQNHTESFIVLKGKLAVVLFADDGRPSEHVVLTAGVSPWGVEVPAGTWHTTLALEPGTVLFEVLEGPWNPATHKQFPSWAVSESDVAAGQAFIVRLREDLMLY